MTAPGALFLCPEFGGGHVWASIDWWSIARSGISTAGGMLLAWWLIWRSEKAAGKEKAALQSGPNDYTGKHNQGDRT